MSKKQQEAACPLKKTSIGGQALIEGVMMRGPEKTAMAVRHTSGEIVMEEWATKGKERAKWTKLPFIRGVINMVESLQVGYKCLMRSATLSGLEAEEDAEEARRRAEKAAKKAAKKAKKEGKPLPEVEEVTPPPATGKREPTRGEKALFSVAMVFSVVLGLALAMGLFMVLPTFLYTLLKTAAPALNADSLWWVQSVFEGVVRLIIFLAYISLVSLMKDIRRVFMYHGAEHKSIFCYEMGLPLTVENVRAQSRFHPRCGTSFLVLVLIVGILVSLCVPIRDNDILRIVVKTLLIPVVVSVGYELIKLAGRSDNAFTRFISIPGLWVQRLTTKEPDDDMIECAIASLKAVIPDDPEADNW